jgi:hypothetical protein
VAHAGLILLRTIEQIKSQADSPRAFRKSA